MDANKLEIINRAVKGEAVLVTFSGVYTLNTQMVNKRLEINNRVVLTKGYDVIVKTVLTGLVTLKDVNCLIMGGKGIVLVSQMIEYYTTAPTADPIKLAQISFSLTELTKGKAGDVYDRNMIVSSTFHAIVADMILKHYPVTLLLDTDYGTAINNYNTAVPGWGNGEVIKNAANEQIGIECRKLTNENFPSMKRFVLGYKLGNELFNSQIIIAYKSRSVTARKKSIELHVEEFETGIDVVGYKAILVASDGTPHEMIGGLKGLSLWNSLATDVYTLLLTRAGYIDKTIGGIGYTAGKFLKIETKMVIGVNPMMSEAVAKVALVKGVADKDTVITEVEDAATDTESDEPGSTDVPTK